MVNEILEGIEDMEERQSPSIEDVASKYMDPLDKIDQEEKEISKNNDYKDLENKFVLSNNIAAMNVQKFNNIIYETNITISEKLYNYYTDKGSSSNTPLGSNFGIPRCIAVKFKFIIYLKI